MHLVCTVQHHAQVCTQIGAPVIDELGRPRTVPVTGRQSHGVESRQVLVGDERIVIGIKFQIRPVPSGVGTARGVDLDAFDLPVAAAELRVARPPLVPGLESGRWSEHIHPGHDAAVVSDPRIPVRSDLDVAVAPDVSEVGPLRVAELTLVHLAISPGVARLFPGCEGEVAGAARWGTADGSGEEGVPLVVIWGERETDPAASLVGVVVAGVLARCHRAGAPSVAVVARDAQHQVRHVEGGDSRVARRVDLDLGVLADVSEGVHCIDDPCPAVPFCHLQVPVGGPVVCDPDVAVVGDRAAGPLSGVAVIVSGLVQP